MQPKRLSMTQTTAKMLENRRPRRTLARTLLPMRKANMTPQAIPAAAPPRLAIHGDTDSLGCALPTKAASKVSKGAAKRIIKKNNQRILTGGRDGASEAAGSGCGKAAPQFGQ